MKSPHKLLKPFHRPHENVKPSGPSQKSFTIPPGMRTYSHWDDTFPDATVGFLFHCNLCSRFSIKTTMSTCVCRTAAKRLDSGCMPQSLSRKQRAHFEQPRNLPEAVLLSLLCVGSWMAVPPKDPWHGAAWHKHALSHTLWQQHVAPIRNQICQARYDLFKPSCPSVPRLPAMRLYSATAPGNPNDSHESCQQREALRRHVKAKASLAFAASAPAR